jgi:hypothetical protein
MVSRLQYATRSDGPASQTSMAIRVGGRIGLSAAWPSNPPALCPTCRKRPGVVSEHVGEPALCAHCFVIEQGDTS